MLLRFVNNSSIRSQFIPLRSSWYSSDNASPKPFSEIPSPGGALPVLGHYLRTRKEPFSKEVEKMFKEVDGPIFRLNVFGMLLRHYKIQPLAAERMQTVLFFYYILKGDLCDYCFYR